MTKRILLVSVVGLLLNAPFLYAGDSAQELWEKAQAMRRPRAQFAEENGAKIVLSPDEKTFYLLWMPPGVSVDGDLPYVVTLGGHSTWALDDFYVWHPFLKNRKYGFLAIQWWYGENQSPAGYLSPQQVYRIIDSVLKKAGTKPGKVLFHGFSRGSANSYAVAALDRFSGNHYFGLIVANAGPAISNYSPTREVETGVFGAMPLAGTKWVTFAGAKDPNPDRDGIPGMRMAGAWIGRYGGEVVLAIEDPEGDHGSFHRNPKNCEAALDLFEKLQKEETI